jgi:hypothetical protein
MSNTIAPKIDESQDMKMKNKSTPPFTYKHKNVPALTFDELESNIVDIEYKVI